ncbi:MAG TPA: ATP-binding protein [Thermoanaerobaculia bacterium]|jgi:hypothetical protein|nr:ATP-binding protein [Thermoanaerobaculia bacterium]
MTENIPLGERESLHREFKSREALKRPELIAREVVAMLNAKGGVVWVGLRDEGDRAVEVEPISGAERERRRLRDYLLDTIEPSPAGDEVEVDVVAADRGEILRIETHPKPDRLPYAHLKESGRWFVVRISDRTRPMTREEIFHSQHVPRETDTARDAAILEVLKERKRIQETAGERLWLALKPVPAIELDLQDRRLKALLLDPALTDNRRSGWNFSTFGEEPRVRQGRLVTGCEDDARAVEIRRDGFISFSVLLKGLWWKGDASEIWPPALWEYPLSALRLAGKIYSDHLGADASIVADLSVIGVKGWKLRAGSPRSGTINFNPRPKEFVEADDLLLEKPLVFSSKDIVQEPDRCGARLLERVYEAFGYGREAFPPEFDEETGRLTFPE